jgi:hypothetical protein
MTCTFRCEFSISLVHAGLISVAELCTVVPKFPGRFSSSVVSGLVPCPFTQTFGPEFSLPQVDLHVKSAYKAILLLKQVQLATRAMRG